MHVQPGAGRDGSLLGLATGSVPPLQNPGSYSQLDNAQMGAANSWNPLLSSHGLEANCASLLTTGLHSVTSLARNQSPCCIMLLLHWLHISPNPHRQKKRSDLFNTLCFSPMWSIEHKQLWIKNALLLTRGKLTSRSWIHASTAHIKQL